MFSAYELYGDNMKCLRCNNQDIRFFYQDPQGWYCRKCVMFGRLNVAQLPTKKHYQKRALTCNYSLKYPLTPLQKKAQQQIMDNLSAKRDVLVYAVCGSGKTELVMEAIKQYINAEKKVGFAISRRQVVLEICERLKAAFSTITVIPVCEGYTDVIDADLIVCTMHQLHRYYECFDLLIMDEVDAFPYRDNEVLESIAMHACIGEKLYLTATPSDAMLSLCEEKKCALIQLYERPHGYPLIVPKIIATLASFQYLYLFYFLIQQRRANIQTLVFVPSIALATRLYRVFRFIFKCAAFSSKTENKDQIIDDFHAFKYECLFATTILERGITIKGVYVIVVQSDHMVFNEASLTQIIGRVGRSIEMPTGKGVFLCRKKNREITRCVNALIHMNAKAES